MNILRARENEKSTTAEVSRKSWKSRTEEKRTGRIQDRASKELPSLEQLGARMLSVEYSALGNNLNFLVIRKNCSLLSVHGYVISRR